MSGAGESGDVHERVARALEALHPDRLDDFCERLAHHYTQTPNAEKALEYLERANHKAIAANAVGEAAAYFGQAMELLDQIPDTAEHRHQRISLLMAQFNVFFLLHRPADYFELLRRYEALVNEVGDPSLVAVFYTHIGQSFMIFGDGARSLETLRRAVEACEASGELATYGMACALIGCAHMWLANYDDILPWLEKADRAFEEHLSLTYYKYARTHHSWAYAQRGCWREAVEEGEASLLAGYEHHDDSVVSFSAAVLAWVYAAWGRTEPAAEMAELAVEKAPTPADRVWSQTFGGFAWCRIGQVQRVIDTLAGLGPLYEAAGFTYGWIMNQTYLGEAYWRAGELDDARRVLEAATARAEPIGMRFFYGLGERLLGEVLADEGGEPTERDRAASHLERAIAVLGEIGAEKELALAHAAYGRLCDRRGQAGPAGEHLVRARTILERLGAR